MLSKLVVALVGYGLFLPAIASTKIPCVELKIPVAKPNGTGQYEIASRYCHSLKQVESRKSTLQLLVHGATYTLNYWSGLGAPGTLSFQDQYSWILYAANQGYPTLSIDRLCNGKSSHPNGTTDCTIPIEAATIHELIRIVRDGQMYNGSPKFTTIILIGHSLGSITSNGFSATYPSDIDGLILTGFSTSYAGNRALGSVAGLEPAAAVFPKRFGNRDLSYLVFTNKSAVETAFYYDKFKPKVFNYNYAHRGTVTIGEGNSSVPFGQQPAPNFRGPVFALNGNDDIIFCSKSVANARAGKPGNCSAEFTERVKSFYPAARSFGYHNTPDTGHCLNLHTTAQQSFKAAHDFLAQVGF